jgi:hypothetical protein
MRAPSIVVATILLGFSATPRVALAAEDRESREREARRACFAGNVERGIELLVDLYGETGHPNYLYNQARCFERNGRYDQALLSYQDYLRKAKNIGAAERAEVEKAMADLRARPATPPQNEPRPVTPPPAGVGDGQAPALPERPPELLPPAAAPVSPAPLPAAADQEPAWRRPVAISALAAGGGMLVLGIVGHLLREGRAGDFNERCYHTSGTAFSFDGNPDATCQETYDGVQSAERLMWIGYVGAPVLAAAGLTLLLTGRHGEPRVAGIGFRCGPAAGVYGAVCAGQF